MVFIHRSEIVPERWFNSTGLPPDGKEHFRERKEYGNRHAIFERGAQWGTVHVDDHNATDFPVGTVNHLAKYTSERTGMPEAVAKAGIALGAIYLGYRGLKALKLL